MQRQYSFQKKETNAMKSAYGKVFLSLVAFALLTLATLRQAAADCPWKSLAPLSTPRESLAAATGLDGRIYAIGGYSSGIINTVDAYDPGTNSWATISPMPTARYNLGVTTGADGRIYALGGYNGKFLNTAEAYDPKTNIWTSLPPMPTVRGGVRAASGLDGRIYAIGGYSSGFLNTVDAYDPTTNTWASVAPMPTPRSDVAAVTGMDGRIYVIGGATGANPILSEVIVYDPSSNTWSTAAPMPTARYDHAAALGKDGRIYVMGGRHGDPPGQQHIVTTVEAYDPKTNTWTTINSMSTPRYAFGAAGLNGVIYAIGGWTGSIDTASVEAYDTTAAVYTVSGTITLDGCLNSVQSINFEFRQNDLGCIFTRIITLAADGSFSLTDIPAMSYNLAIKGSKWLRSVVPVDASNGNVSNVVTTLLAGDANNDNIVDFDDLTILAIAYNTVTGDPLYDDRADFNCDGQVEFDDLTLLAINYNLSGDP